MFWADFEQNEFALWTCFKRCVLGKASFALRSFFVFWAKQALHSGVFVIIFFFTCLSVVDIIYFIVTMEAN